MTAAGNAYQKHTNRPGNASNPNLPKVPYSQMNMAGENFVWTILNHPNAIFNRKEVQNVGIFFDIEVPNIGGLRYTLDGKLRGFLNP